MKRLLLILLIVSVTGCAWFQPKAPPTRFGLMWAMSERQNYDLAMEMAGTLFKAGIISEQAMDHIESIGVNSDAIYWELKPILTAYSEGAVRLHVFEDKINEFHRKELELNSTMKAYLKIIKWEGINVTNSK